MKLTSLAQLAGVKFFLGGEASGKIGELQLRGIFKIKSTMVRT